MWNTVPIPIFRQEKNVGQKIDSVVKSEDSCISFKPVEKYSSVKSSEALKSTLSVAGSKSPPFSRLIPFFSVQCISGVKKFTICENAASARNNNAIVKSRVLLIIFRCP